MCFCLTRVHMAHRARNPSRTFLLFSTWAKVVLVTHVAHAVAGATRKWLQHRATIMRMRHPLALRSAGQPPKSGCSLAHTLTHCGQPDNPEARVTAEA